MKARIIGEIPMNMSELKQELQKIKKRDKELNFRSQKTLEYLDQFVSLSNAKAEELKSEIEKLNVPRLRDQHIHKIIDILPKTSADVKLVLQGYSVSVTNENLKKIADVVVKVVGG